MTLEEFLASRAAGDEAVEKLLAEITEFQSRTATRIAGILADLEIVSGRLVASPANMARLSTAIADLEANFADQKWQKAVGEYLATFTELETGLLAYAEGFGALDKGLLTALKVQYQTVIGPYLLDARSFSPTLQQPIVEQATTYILEGGKFKDLVQSVSDVITAGKDGNGAIHGNIHQAVNDTISIYQRTATNLASESVGAVFFYFAGPKVAGSRAWCLARKGKYFHKKEIQGWGDDTWAGQMPGTNATTIFSMLGGFGCLDVLVPVAKRDVPKADLQRMEAKGYI